MGKYKAPEHFHELLAEIVEQFGEEILTESKLKGIIGDMAAGSDILKLQAVISRSITYHVGQRILQCRDLDDADLTLRISILKQAFQEDNFFQHSVADYVIDSYLFALGWIDDVEEFEEAETGYGNAKAGELSFVERDGCEYCGNTNKEGDRSGFGIAKQEDGSYFAGEWKLDMKAGIGIHIEPERGRYAGEWRMNRRNGIGIDIQEDGTRYAGEWKNGKMNGIGTLYFPNGERMCARFEKGNIQNEPGVYYLQDGTYVTGCMSKNGPDGTCVHYYKDGSTREEKWSQGVRLNTR